MPKNGVSRSKKRKKMVKRATSLLKKLNPKGGKAVAKRRKKYKKTDKAIKKGY
jgi:hypothetical protein